MKRSAAAILLTSGDGAVPEVFLVERAQELRFFGGYHALPGGVRGPEDGPDDPGSADLEPLRRCALRELAEETGIVLPSAQALTEICRIETPPFAPVRYDTVFFAAGLPGGQTPRVETGELSGGRFWQPETALAAWRRGEVLIVPPVLILLELLLRHGRQGFPSAAQAIAADYRTGRLHRVRFAPGIVMASVLSPTLPPATTTNCYLVGEEKLYIVDPGSPEEPENLRLIALIDELVAEGRELAGILLTHHHPDHIGGVNRLSTHYDLPVRGHRLTLGRLPRGFRAGAEIADQERITLGRAPDGQADWALIAVHTPGHDRGHLCFRDTRYASVLAGDMLSTISTIVIDPPEGHLRTYLESLERLLAEPMGTLHPAHGPAARDGHRLVRQYLRHRQQRESGLLAALTEMPATAEQLVPKVYWDADPKLFPIALRSLLAGLEKLREDGRACEERGIWRRTS